jgi:LysR family transcriptional regulator, cyn operon transcriptional activator
MTSEPAEIRHFRYFLAVAEAGSFSRAASRLGVSQPNVSQQLRDLEMSLHVPLFQRRGKRILLTSAGLIFQEHARAILRQLDSLMQELTAEPETMRGAIHVGVVPVLSIALIPRLLGIFAANYPGISLHIEEISSTTIETAIEEGEMDIGLGFLTHHSPNLRYERLYHDRFALLVHTSHPWAERTSVDVSELHQARMLQLPNTFVMRRMSDAICRESQVRPRVIAEINSIEALLRCLPPLHAAAFMPKIALHGTNDLIAVPLKGKKLDLEIGLLRLIGSAANGAVKEFAKIARTAVPKIIEEVGTPDGNRTPGRKVSRGKSHQRSAV